MKINITKAQFKTLTEALETSVYPIEILSDSLADKTESKKYKEKAQKIRALQKHFYEYNKKFECDEYFEKYEDEYILKDDYIEEFAGNTIFDYEKFVIFEFDDADNFDLDYGKVIIDRAIEKNIKDEII